ncbi:hypothetical protein [Microlunatus speluncae]|uniref:hypothetical protein n=1 Tax=Microlunatus speluncae TaxID=2594267 RepID=UPI0013763AF9|nr:hypothetical protein [Microlunatus speluncae]
MSELGPIRVCTVVLRNDAGAVLTVRKRGRRCGTGDQRGRGPSFMNVPGTL